MTVASSQITVTNAPTALASGQFGTAGVPVQVTVRNTHATVSVFLGPVGVTTAGFELIAGAAETMDLIASDDLYGITASTSVRVDVLKTRG